MIVMAGFFVGPRPSKIAELTGLDESYVRAAGADLYDSALWLPDGKIGLEYPNDEDHTFVEIVLHAMCAYGALRRVREHKKGFCIDCNATTSRRWDRYCAECFRKRLMVLTS
jgi:hypothetical protein